jgi:hypothetical protein
MLCIIHAKHDSEDKQTGYWQTGCPSCMRNKIDALRAENERLSPMYDLLCDDYKQLKIDLEVRDARIAKLEAALRDARYLLENHASEKHILERIAAALKGDAE